MKTSMNMPNNSESDRPRLVCRVVQGWGSVVGDGAVPPEGAWGARHVAACECCRVFFNRSGQLDLALRRSVEGERVAVPPGLEQRIVGAVQRAARETPRAIPRSSMGSLALMGAAASVALGILVFQTMRAPEPVPEVPSAGMAAVSASGDEAVEADGTGAWSRLSPNATALLEAEPLQREVDAFYSDARSALGFLALNFLPSSSRASGMGAEQTAPARRPASG